MEHHTESEMSVEALQALYEISSRDLMLIRTHGEVLAKNLDPLVGKFYEWLEKQPEFSVLFESPEQVARVRALQVSYWSAFLKGVLDEDYVVGRRRVGGVHARIGLSLSAYFAAMDRTLALFADELDEHGLSAPEFAATLRALTKLIHLDTAIVVETFSRIIAETLAEQSRSLMAMSTPVTAIWRDILLLPIVGVIDSKRAQDITTGMLNKIAETQAKVIILDIGGVAIVDTAVANHLIKITKATKLMGCECTISGVSPSIAQTVVELGIDVGDISTTATLRDALQSAFRRVGVTLANES
jgi:rsbT co-antagonist protein RsbR